MGEFAEDAPAYTQDALLRAIHGAGAFRYFKDTLRRFRMENNWYAFRDQATA
jgi:hypothetical protein